MKFEYVNEQPRGEIKAIIHKSGSLIIKTERGYVLLGPGGKVFEERGTEDINRWEGWLSNPHMVLKAFYPGDKVTITF